MSQSGCMPASQEVLDDPKTALGKGVKMLKGGGGIFKSAAVMVLRQDRRLLTTAEITKCGSISLCAATRAALPPSQRGTHTALYSPSSYLSMPFFASSRMDVVPWYVMLAMFLMRHD